MDPKLSTFINNLKTMHRWSPQPPEYYTYAKDPKNPRSEMIGSGYPHAGDADLGLWNIKWLVMSDHSDVALRTELDSNLQDRACLAPEIAKMRLYGKALQDWALEMPMNKFIDMCLNNWGLFITLFQTVPHCRTLSTPNEGTLYKRFTQRRKK